MAAASALERQIAGLIAADVRCDWRDSNFVCRRLDAIEQLMRRSIADLYECTYYDVCCDGRILSSPETTGPYGGDRVTIEDLESVGLDETIFALPELAVRSLDSEDSEVDDQTIDTKARGAIQDGRPVLVGLDDDELRAVLVGHARSGHQVILAVRGRDVVLELGGDDDDLPSLESPDASDDDDSDDADNDDDDE